ncbi:MAG: hypothetical protein M3N19_07865 [Candidatus Eremiobacteraeota bacterium]|nr:hypothetical protein [Candidatus Eremiobacteraeota bacterium]
MIHDPVPEDALKAATHANPYPYYARLVQEAPFFFDPALHAWIASDSRHVEAVFVHPQARVVAPEGLTHEVRQHLARFNDGAEHATLRSHVTTLLDALEVHGEASPGVLGDTVGLDDFIRAFPVYAVANALDILPARVPQILEKLAAGWTTIGSLTTEFGIHPAVAGLLFQTYDATRGLIGNTLLAMLRAEANIDQNSTDYNLRASIDRTVREDSPVQNTRRVMRSAAHIGDTHVTAGADILLVIGAANRDPAASQVFTFGMGAHACPGQRLAVATTQAALRLIFARNMHRSANPDRVTYLASRNARIPIFNTQPQGFQV